MYYPQGIDGVVGERNFCIEEIKFLTKTQASKPASDVIYSLKFFD